MRTRLLLVALLAGMALSALPIASAIAAPRPVALSSSASVSGSAVVAEAEKYLGYPYAYIGDSPATGFSCIGFVWYVYHQLGQNIPGSLGPAMAAFPTVAEKNLEPGDIVFFQDTEWAGVSHVAIYIGDGKVIGADNPSVGVAINSLVNDPQDGNYWQDHYLVSERPWTGAAGTVPVGGSGVRKHRHHYLTVLVSSLNVRSLDSLTSSVRTIVPYGTRLLIRGWRPGWIRIRTPGGVVGWVVRAGVSVRNRTGPEDIPQRHQVARPRTLPNVRTVNAYALRVHVAPSFRAAIAFNLIRGDRVGLLRHFNGWDKIEIANGSVGWAPARFIGSQTNTTGRGPHSRSSPAPLRGECSEPAKREIYSHRGQQRLSGQGTPMVPWLGPHPTVHWNSRMGVASLPQSPACRPSNGCTEKYTASHRTQGASYSQRTASDSHRTPTRHGRLVNQSDRPCLCRPARHYSGLGFRVVLRTPQQRSTRLHRRRIRFALIV